MKFRHVHPEVPEINLTPLIDVVFLLLIFFMVSTTFERESELNIELPQATSEPETEKKDTIDIALDAEGRYYVNGRQLVNTQFKTMKQALLDAAGGQEDPSIIITADARTPHQAVISVMDAASQLGFLHLSFPTRPTPDQEQ